MAHLAEVLDASLRGLPVTELTGRSDNGQSGPDRPARVTG